MSEIVTVGLDLAQNVFQVHGADCKGRAILLPTPGHTPVCGSVRRALKKPSVFS